VAEHVLPSTGSTEKAKAALPLGVLSLEQEAQEATEAVGRGLALQLMRMTHLTSSGGISQPSKKTGKNNPHPLWFPGPPGPDTHSILQLQ
jgi:hypothetical protein